MKQHGEIFTSQKIARLGQVFSKWNVCLIIAMLCFSATCERPIDLDLDFDLPDPELVVISNFTLGEPVKVRLSKSQHILDETPSEYLANAVVTLFEGDRFLEELKLVIDLADRIPPYYITENFIPEHSVTYSIVVEADGFETVTAHSFIPVPVHIDNFSVSELSMRTGVKFGHTEFSYDVALNFTDPQDEENYYHLNFYQEVLDYTTNSDSGDTIRGGSRLLQVSFSNLDNSNYVEAFIGGGVLLKENPFDEGLTFSLRLSINADIELLGTVYAELRTVSAEYFNFHTSVSRQQEQPDDPFQTEIVIFDNIMNGQGVFAGYNITLDSTILDIN